MVDFRFYLNKQGPRGPKGEKGEQGFSPTINIGENTASELTLVINNEFGSFETPNLRGEQIDDQGGTYVRFNQETKAMYAGNPEYASEENYGMVKLADDESIEVGASDRVVTAAQLQDAVGAVQDEIITPNNGKLTIQRNTVTIGEFTADSSEDKTINITVPVSSADLVDGPSIAKLGDITAALTPYVKSSQLADVATSGSYADLKNTPTIPTVNNGTLTIVQNGQTIGTFTANQAGNTTVTIQGGDVSGFVTTDQLNNEIDARGQADARINDRIDALSSQIVTPGDGKLTITQGGQTLGVFTANQSGDVTIDIEAGGSGDASIDDESISTDKVWSSDKTNESIQKSAIATLQTVASEFVGVDNLVAGEGITIEKSTTQEVLDDTTTEITTMTISADSSASMPLGFSFYSAYKLDNPDYILSTGQENPSKVYTSLSAWIERRVEAGELYFKSDMAYAYNGSINCWFPVEKPVVGAWAYSPTDGTPIGQVTTVNSNGSLVVNGVTVSPTGGGNAGESLFTAYDFKINKANNTFKLPTKTKLASGNAVVGDGKSIGLTTGSLNVSLSGTASSAIGNASIIYSAAAGYGSKVGTSVTGAYTNLQNNSIGVTLDPDKSGIVTSDNNLYLYFYAGTAQNIDEAVSDMGQITDTLALKADVTLENINNEGKSVISNMAMPSTTPESLSIGASGSSYTAPANGWFVVEGVSASNTGASSPAYVNMRGAGGIGSQILILSGSLGMIANLPCAKGDKVTISYASVSINKFVFNRAKGDE